MEELQVQFSLKANKGGNLVLMSTFKMQYNSSGSKITINNADLSFRSMSNRSKDPGIVLHHTGGSYANVEDIHSFHKGKGWAGIGYHFVIFSDGKIWEGRPWGKKGAHTPENNSKIGICVEGNYDKKTLNTYQYSSLYLLIQAVIYKMRHTDGITENIKLYYHRDWSDKSCPGWSFPTKAEILNGIDPGRYNISEGTTSKSGSSAVTKDYDASYGVHDGKMWYVPCDFTRLSSPFGMRLHPTLGVWKMHNGIDLAAPSGTPIYSTRAGTVCTVAYNDISGYHVVVDHGDGYKSKYLHMKENSFAVKKGDIVIQGQKLGEVGSTGRSTGAHLHFGITYNNEAKDPEDFIFGQGTVIEIDLPIEIKEDIQLEYDPLFTDKSVLADNFSGNMHSFNLRRNQLISNSYTTLVKNGKVHECACGGYSDIGLGSGKYVTNSQVGDIINVTDVPTKSRVESLYIYGPNHFRTGAFTGDNETLIAKYIFTKLRTYAWNDLAIIALLANMKGESGLNPARFQNDAVGTWSNDIGVGLVQWTPGTNLKKRVGKIPGYEESDWYDIDAQLYLIGKELDNYTAAYRTFKATSRSDYNRDVRESEAYKYDAEYNKIIKDSMQSSMDHGRFFAGVELDDFRSGLPNLITNNETKLKLLTTAFTYNYERPRYLSVDLRIKYAFQFLEKLGESIYVDDYESDAFKSTSKGGKNPYPVRNGSSTIPSNNAYIWGKVYNSLADDLIKNKKLPESPDIDWFEYVKDKQTFKVGQIPRNNSIACWKYLGTDKSYERSYVSYVESVYSTDLIFVNECQHCEKKSATDNKISKQVRKNYKNNWELPESDYRFQGFIYLSENLDNISENDDSISLRNYLYGSNSSIVFKINDIRHHNRLKIVYDYEVILPESLDVKKVDGKFTTNMYFTQMITSTDHPSLLWPKTYLPLDTDKDDDCILTLEEYNQRYPFPFGVLMLDNDVPKGILNKENKNDISFILNEEERIKLNNISHPLIIEEMKKRINKY